MGPRYQRRPSVLGTAAMDDLCVDIDVVVVRRITYGGATIRSGEKP